jgi:hypothetical protein
MDQSTGEGLDILIKCESTYLQNWMVFACWYSISVNLPDANVVIGCDRSLQSRILFEWPNRCSVNFFQCNDDSDFVSIAFGRKFISSKTPIILPPHTMAVREYDQDNIGPIDAKSNERATFVHYHEGCGKFVASEWIDRFVMPFEGAIRRFGSDGLSINEIAILRLWERMHVASRGML